MLERRWNIKDKNVQLIRNADEVKSFFKDQFNEVSFRNDREAEAWFSSGERVRIGKIEVSKRRNVEEAKEKEN